MLLRLSVFALFLAFSTAWAAEPQYQVAVQHEGIYTVRIECRDGDSPQQCQEVEGLVTMIVMNGSPVQGVAVSLVDPNTDLPRYAFSGAIVRNNGRVVEARGSLHSAELHLEFSATDTSILGWIRDPRFLYDLRITGTIDASTQSLYLPEAGSLPLTVGNVVGVYTGSEGGRPLRLVIRKAATGSKNDLIASALLENIVWTEFPFGTIDAEHGVVNLWQEPDMFGTTLKWTFAYRTDGDKRTLTGIGFSGQQARWYSMILARQVSH